MRVADRTTARNYLKYMNKAKMDFAKTNERIASGHRFEQLSDDVSAGTRVLRVRSEMYKSQKQYDNVKSINDEMSTAESAMMSINDILNDIHGTKIVKAMNEPTSEAGRTAIANEVKAMREEILQFANTQYSKKYVFGGSNASMTAPFTLNKDGKILYNGVDMDEIQRRDDGSYFYMKDGAETEIPMDKPTYLDIGMGVRMNGNVVDPTTGFKITTSGIDILGFGKNVDGSSNNIYNLLTQVEANMRNFDKEALGKADANLVQLTDKFRANITEIGAKTNFLDTMQDRLKTTIDNQKARVNTLMGTKDEEEATNQTMNEYVLKAIMQMGSRILPVSLMDFLR